MFLAVLRRVPEDTSSVTTGDMMCRSIIHRYCPEWSDGYVYRLVLLSWHRADGTEVRSESYRYTRVNDHPMPTATQRTIYLDRSKENFTSAKVAWLTMTNTYSYLPESTVVREGEYSDSTWTHYNSARQIISKSEMSSDGTQRTSRVSTPLKHGGSVFRDSPQDGEEHIFEP